MDSQSISKTIASDYFDLTSASCERLSAEIDEAIKTVVTEKDKEIERLNKYIQEMVRITAENRLDGYRELSMKALEQTERAEKAEAELAVLLERMKGIEYREKIRRAIE